jgi:hypothetical protein
MSMSIACPLCHERFEVPDEPAGKVSCPACRHTYSLTVRDDTQPAEAVLPQTEKQLVGVRPLPEPMPAPPTLVSGRRFMGDDDEPARPQERGPFPIWVIVVGAGVVLALLLLVAGVAFVGLVFFGMRSSARQAQVQRDVLLAEEEAQRDRAAEAVHFQTQCSIQSQGRDQRFLPCACWLSDDSFACIDDGGRLTVARSQAEAPLEARTREFHQKPFGMIASQGRLAITFVGDQNIRIFDPKTLDEVQAIGLPWQPGHLAIANRASPLAWDISLDYKRVSLINLQAGDVRGTWNASDFGEEYFLNPVVSFDGRFLLTRHEHVVRYRLDGVNLVKSETSEDSWKFTPGGIALNRDAHLAMVYGVSDVKVVDIDHLDHVRSRFTPHPFGVISAAAFDPELEIAYFATVDGDLSTHPIHHDEPGEAVSIRQFPGCKIVQLAPNYEGATDRMLIVSEREVQMLIRSADAKRGAR